MKQRLNYEEWFLQSDYDMEVAGSMLQSGRNIYCIFMCHLSLEKALKAQTYHIYQQAKTIQQWIKAQ